MRSNSAFVTFFDSAAFEPLRAMPAVVAAVAAIKERRETYIGWPFRRRSDTASYTPVKRASLDAAWSGCLPDTRQTAHGVCLLLAGLRGALGFFRGGVGRCSVVTAARGGDVDLGQPLGEVFFHTGVV